MVYGYVQTVLARFECWHPSSTHSSRCVTSVRHIHLSLRGSAFSSKTSADMLRLLSSGRSTGSAAQPATVTATTWMKFMTWQELSRMYYTDNPFSNSLSQGAAAGLSSWGAANQTGCSAADKRPDNLSLHFRILNCRHLTPVIKCCTAED